MAASFLQQLPLLILSLFTNINKYQHHRYSLPPPLPDVMDHDLGPFLFSTGAKRRYESTPPLVWAASKGNTKRFLSLLSLPQYRTNLSDTGIGYSCLDLGIILSDIEVVRALVSLPPGLFERTGSKSILHHQTVRLTRLQINLIRYPTYVYPNFAALREEFEIFKLIAETGRVDITARDPKDEGMTPLQRACYSGSIEILDLILARYSVKATVDVLDNSGRTPLSFAAENGHDMIVEWLLKFDAVDPDLVDYRKRTPYYYAIRYGHEAIGQVLLDTRCVNRIKERALSDREADQRHDVQVKGQSANPSG
jgi:ankyrin repeat protein